MSTRLFRQSAFLRALRSLAVLPLLAACGDITGIGDDERDFERAERRWYNSQIYDYDYVLRQSCFCPSEIVRPVRVTVRNGFVYDLRYEDTFTPVPPFAWSAFPTVEGLFDLVDDALYRADDVDLSFDREFGFPRLIAIDYARGIADDELTLRTAGFRAY